MILIITNKNDAHVDFITQILSDKDQQYYRLNTESLLEDTSLSVLFSNNNVFWNIFSHQSQIELNAIKSAWFRRPLPGYVDPRIHKSNREYVQQELDAALKGIWSTIPRTAWVNTPAAIWRASNKILQLKIAQEVGLKIPRTIITSNPEDARTFFKTCGNGIVVKVLTKGVFQDDNKLRIVFTNRIQSEHYPRLEDVKYAPTQLQEYIEKAYELRITIVGKEIFTCEIYSQESEETKTDWRKYASVPYKQGDIPAPVREAIMNFMRKLGLQYGAIDMIYTPDGEYIFLEINPSGQWLWVEEKVGLPISNALINMLIK